MKHVSPERGSALLLAVLIIALVGTVGFGLIRIALMQSRIANSSSNAIQAYNAAEAGLEYALLQYRIDKDREIGTATAPVAFTMNANQSFAVSMTHSATIFGTQSCLDRVASTFTVFSQCDAPPTNDPYSPLNFMQPNETLTFQTAQDASLIVLRAVKNDFNNDPAVVTQDDASRGVLQIQFYNRDADGTEHFLMQKVYKLGEADGIALAKTAGGIPVHGPLSFNKVSLLYLHDNDVSLAVVVKMQQNTVVRSFDTGITTISATGSAGGVKRRMAARIDRRTDRVLGVFDFALHAQAVSTP